MNFYPRGICSWKRLSVCLSVCPSIRIQYWSKAAWHNPNSLTAWETHHTVLVFFHFSETNGCYGNTGGEYRGSLSTFWAIREVRPMRVK